MHVQATLVMTTCACSTEFVQKTNDFAVEDAMDCRRRGETIVYISVSKDQKNDNDNNDNVQWRETIIYLSPAPAPAHTQSTRREGEGRGRNQGVSELPHTGFVLPQTARSFHTLALCFHRIGIVLPNTGTVLSFCFNAYFKCSTNTGDGIKV